MSIYTIKYPISIIYVILIGYNEIMTIIFYLQFSNIDSYQNSFTAIIATPKTVSTIPVILLRRSGVALLANIAATLAPVSYTHLDVYKRQDMYAK